MDVGNHNTATSFYFDIITSTTKKNQHSPVTNKTPINYRDKEEEKKQIKYINVRYIDLDITYTWCIYITTSYAH